MDKAPVPTTSVGALWKAISTPWAIYGQLDRATKQDEKIERLTEKVDGLTERLSHLEGLIESLLPHIDTKVKLAVMEAMKDRKAE